MSIQTPATAAQRSLIHELPSEDIPRIPESYPIHELPGEDVNSSYPPIPYPKPRYPAPNQIPPPGPDSVVDSTLFSPDIDTKEPVVIPDSTVTLELRGLRKPNNPSLFKLVITMSLYNTLSELSDLITRRGYLPPVGFQYKELSTSYSANALPITVPVAESEGIPEWPLLVADGPSCYDPQKGLRINRKEPFTAYLSRLQVHVQCTDSQLVINGGFQIGFYRTLRVPEDGKVHNLPAQFGLFHLQNVAAYSEKLHKSNNSSLLDIAKKSGVFFPMYQREAMWISFTLASWSPIHEYAVRVFVGGINVVSGRKWDQPESSEKTRKQDYVIVPPQEHLDGIAVSRDTVRQFIAMPIGSGYSIEKQMTGKEDVGGLQLEVIPTTAKLVIQFNTRCDVGYEWLPNPSVASAAYYNLQSGIDIFIVQDGNGDVVMGGHVQEQRRVLLRELIGISLDKQIYPLDALYRTKLKITFKSRFSKQTMTTREFSPFDKVQKVLDVMSESGKDNFSLDLSSRPKVLNPNSTLIDDGIIGFEESMSTTVTLPELIAVKSDRKAKPAAQQPIGNVYRPPKNSFSMFRRRKEAYHLPQSAAAGMYGAPCSAPVLQSSGSPQAPQYSYGRPPPHLQPVACYSPVGLPNASLSYPPPPTQKSSAHSPIAVPPDAIARSPSTPSPKQKPSTEDGWTMGIAAGGRLRQQILPDRDIHRSSRWNKSAIGMISVQVLNSVAFEAITGMVTPPTPITLRTYLEAGIPFFSSYNGGPAAQTSGAANFRVIKSVSEMDASLGVDEGLSVAHSQRVACSSCKQNLCDCILRTCNHAFCSTCVYTRMSESAKTIICSECHIIALRVVGFSAPMALPGEEAVVAKKVPVVILPGIQGKFGFMAELAG
ncbi:uncharacterized protein K441DRAFT_105597 [Cenococcum geophilum 1.58]|uniref:uncharacterized protein n=1 Tax=Cenococcum geophilum 1.58 TaxID=794803 RepID=UPI00358F590A|nr:hypothetical protein K441DRAFT_105597 [Cenococcum geophilum 1.58]